MKPITIFYLTHCPFCKRAMQYIDELIQEYPEFLDIQIEKIEEEEHADIAEKYDYYYVPTFYIDGKKVHEGGIFKNEVETLLRKALE